MTTWETFLWIAGGIVFAASVIDSLIRFVRWYKTTSEKAGKHVDEHIKEIIADDRKTNCPFIRNYERDLLARQRENDLLKEFIANELKPLKEGLEEVRSWNKKMHHALMDDLKVKLRAIYTRFERKGSLSKMDQTNWDKYYSNYASLGGNSDIKRMDEIIQAARLEATLGKARKSKEKETDDEIESTDN